MSFLDDPVLALLTFRASVDPTEVAVADFSDPVARVGLHASPLADLVRGHAGQYMTIRAAVLKQLLAMVTPT